MKQYSHRASLMLAAGLVAPIAALTGSEEAGIGRSFKGPIGLQLYSLRDSFKQDVPATLDKVRGYGFKYVELAGTYGHAPAEFVRMLTQRGLKPIAGHFSYEMYRDDIQKVITEAKALGLEYTGCAWIPHEGDFDLEECRAAIEVFNTAGKALRQAGLKFFYHIHGYEFHPYGDGTLFDLMMDRTDPEAVAYEMDIFWVVFPAQDPVALLKKYGKRWALMHLKDMRKGLETGSFKGGTDVRNDVALGEGQIDMIAVLREAKKIGIKWYFIEDESPEVEVQIPVSLRYLEKARF